MQDKFWTDELVYEFANQLCGGNVVGHHLEQFKSSKSPKKEWEIVAYVFKPLLPEKRVVVNCDSQHWTEAREDTTGLYLIEAVRRLSDGEVFSVGDRIRGFGTPISAIEITDEFSGGLALRFTSPQSGCSIDTARKLPQPILTTVDGVQIFPGDEYYFIDAGWEIRFTGDNYNWVSENIKAFADKEEAILYVQENKPLLSLNDVKYVLDSIQFAHDNTRPFILEVLTNAVKQKLNQ